MNFEKNEEKAFSLYLKAAEAGGLMAANNVSVCYQKGTGTEQNSQQAFFWKEKAAEGDNSIAQDKLAEWYFKGYGTARNYEKALFWFVKSKIDKEDKLLLLSDTLNKTSFSLTNLSTLEVILPSYSSILRSAGLEAES